MKEFLKIWSAVIAGFVVLFILVGTIVNVLYYLPTVISPFGIMGGLMFLLSLGLAYYIYED